MPDLMLPSYAPQIAVDPAPWMEDALCATTDPELFFPEKGDSLRHAKRVCGDCTVQAQCLAYAIAKDLRYGVWGGASDVERLRIRSGRKPREKGWSDEDLELLRTMHEERVPLQEQSERLGRTKAAVMQRRYELGLRVRSIS